MLTDSTALQSPDSLAADARDKDGFEHRIVPASAAAPLPSPGVRSAFDLAAVSSATREVLNPPPSGFKSWLAKKGEGSAEGRAPAGRRALRSPKSKAVVALLTGAHKTADEVAQALRLSRKQAANLLSNMTARGVLMATGDGTGRRTYTVVDDAPALTSPAKAPAAPHTAPTRPARTPAIPRVAAPRPRLSQATSVDETTLRCGLFNDGALHLEAQGQTPLRLNKAQTRVLVDYLDKISTAIAEKV